MKYALRGECGYIHMPDWNLVGETFYAYRAHLFDTKAEALACVAQYPAPLTLVPVEDEREFRRGRGVDF